MNNPDFLQTLSSYKDQVWPTLESYLKLISDLPPYCKINPKYQSLLDFHNKITLEYPERKGKYLRPTLLILTAQSLGLPLEKALNTAAAMQLSEDWILGHDDIEDDSLERRGLPALHQLYGKELAINAGDALHNLVWKILSDNNDILGPQKSKKISDEFFIMINRTLIGQTVEMKWAQENKTDLTDEDILFIIESKTGYYSIAGPMRLGAILAGATTTQLDKIYQFGVILGRAFQIKDDLLDLTSDFAGLKKQIGNDIYEGKRTIMLLHLLRHSQAEDKTKLLKILSKTREQKTETEIKWILEKMNQYGSLKHGQELMEKYMKEAKNIFATDLQFLSQEPYRQHLESFIDFIATRDH